MSETDNRNLGRDSLFLLAELREEGSELTHRVKVRNLSSGGMMGEGPVKVKRGMLIELNLRNIGWVEGSVAWVQGDRFGVAFREEIDPRLARTRPVSADDDTAHTPRFVRPPLSTYDPRNLRKI